MVKNEVIGEKRLNAYGAGAHLGLILRSVPHLIPATTRSYLCNQLLSHRQNRRHRITKARLSGWIEGRCDWKAQWLAWPKGYSSRKPAKAIAKNIRCFFLYGWPRKTNTSAGAYCLLLYCGLRREARRNGKKKVERWGTLPVGWRITIRWEAIVER